MKTIFPFLTNELNRLYNRIAKLKPSMILERDQAEPLDSVHLSTEARKKYILEQARNEVLERIRETK